MKRYAIIVAGGSGTRMGSDTPKQFLHLHGKPVLIHTISSFYNFDPRLTIILVLPDQHIPVWKDLCKTHFFDIPHKIVKGGNTRFESVKNGLNEIEQEGIVGIHDGVRPLVSRETLNRVYSTALEKGNAIPAMPVVESLRKTLGNKNVRVNRDDFRLVQTPQCFKSGILLKAFEQDFKADFTDDASVVESIGTPIYLVDGNRENIKITTPQDLKIAEALMDGMTKME